MTALGLTPDDLVVDLGCGTGQLTLPLAGRTRAVVGMDPEPDMLERARRAGVEQGVTNASWLPAADARATLRPCGSSGGCGTGSRTDR